MSKRFSGLEIEESTDEGRHTLTLGGELDIASAPTLHAAIARIRQAPETGGITLDLSGLIFMMYNVPYR